MSRVVEPRNVSPILKTLRAFLLGREHTNALRFADTIAARTQPAPSLPDGPAHILAANYYYTRDGRREVHPPTVLAIGGGAKVIAAGQDAAVAETKKALPTPGNVWMWD